MLGQQTTRLLLVFSAFALSQATNFDVIALHGIIAGTDDDIAQCRCLSWGQSWCAGGGYTLTDNGGSGMCSSIPNNECGSSNVPYTSEFTISQGDGSDPSMNNYWNGNGYNAYCAGGDGSIIGTCSLECGATPCSGPFEGSEGYKILSCYYDPSTACS